MRSSGRLAGDPGCAGCAHLGTFRALRTAGLSPRGALGCDPGAVEPAGPAPPRFAVVVGLRDVETRGLDAPSLQASRARARLLLVADRAGAARGARGGPVGA